MIAKSRKMELIEQQQKKKIRVLNLNNNEFHKISFEQNKIVPSL